MRKIAAMTIVAMLATTAFAQVGAAVSENAANDLFLSETITVAPGYDGNGMLDDWSAGDMFGITSRPDAAGTLNGLPFAIADDSLVGFPSDTQGIIDENDDGRFFGLVDSVNGANPSGTGAATWEFDISGAGSVGVSLDFAAMGDFENSNDSHVFTYSIDGAPAAPLFTSSVNEDGSQNYTMANGTPVTLDDPMLVNGTTLGNSFTTLTVDALGSGSVLTIDYVGGGDGGSEAFAFRNLIVTPEPASLLLIGLAGLMLRRR